MPSHSTPGMQAISEPVHYLLDFLALLAEYCEQGGLEVDRVLGHGYLISATPAAHYSQKHQSALREAPLERILLEIDSPVSYEGRRSEPADVVRTSQAVARIKEIPETEVAKVTTENAIRVFGLCGSGLQGTR
jgi:hypothetical protein